MRTLATLLFSLSLMLPSASYAQKRFNPHQIYTAGHTSVSLGIGLIPTYLMDGASVVLPPLSFEADYMASNILSVGIQIGHSQSLSNRTKNKTELVKEYYNRTTQI